MEPISAFKTGILEKHFSIRYRKPVIGTGHLKPTNPAYSISRTEYPVSLSSLLINERENTFSDGDQRPFRNGRSTGMPNVKNLPGLYRFGSLNTIFACCVLIRPASCRAVLKSGKWCRMTLPTTSSKTPCLKGSYSALPTTYCTLLPALDLVTFIISGEMSRATNCNSPSANSFVYSPVPQPSS